MGVLVQVTATSFTGKWGKIGRRLADWYAENQLLHVVASDSHGTSHRSPVLSESRKVVSKSFGEEFALAVFEKNPKAIIENQALASV